MIFNYLTFAFLMFCGGFANAVVGGGGILILPGYIALGLPVTNSIATLKMSSTFGHLFSLAQFHRKYKLEMRLLLQLLPFAFAGTIAGVYLFYHTEAAFLEALVPITIVGVVIYTFFNKGMGVKNNYTAPTVKKLLLGGVLTFFACTYDAFFGPGAGIFHTLIFVKFFKIDFIGGSGVSKGINLVVASVAFLINLYNGLVFPIYGVIGALCMLGGTYLGGHFAITKGVKFIRPVFIGLALMIAINMVYKRFA